MILGVKNVAICLAFGLFTAISAVHAAQQEPLILAVHPYLPPDEIVSRFSPLAQEFARATGRPVTVRVGRSYAEHVAAVGTDRVDIAYMGPVSYVRMTQRYGLKPLLARQVVDNDPLLHGEIIVRQDSALHSLEDLRGKRFAYGDQDSTASHIVPLSMLYDAGISEDSLASHGFLGSHKNVVLAVLAGDYDAGAVKEEAFQEYKARGLRSIAAEPGMPDHIFVASTKLPVRLVETLRRTLLQLAQSAHGKAIMEQMHPGMTALVPPEDSDYDGLRAVMGKIRPDAR